MKVRVSNIQRFCLNDGPGIRTTIFFKGCNLKCPWCANPENLDYRIQNYYNKNTNEFGTFGYDIDLNDLYEEIIKDKIYYSLNNGGVTFSGGEPLLQLKKMDSLLKTLKEQNINICIETSLSVSNDIVKYALNYIDTFIIDIKILDKKIAKDVINCDIELYKKNLDTICKIRTIDVFRIPLVSGYTLTDNNVNLIIELLKKYPCKKVEMFEVHNLSENKYSSLNMKFNKFSKIDEKLVNNIYNKIKNIVNDVEILKF